MAKSHPSLEAARHLLDSRSPRLDHVILRSFVSKYFERGKGFLERIPENFLPVYVFDHEALLSRAREFMTAFSGVLNPVSFYYAVKSNNYPGVSKALLDCGFGLDVSSGLELKMALELGAKDMVLSGPGKTDEELSLAVTHSDRVVVLVDSFGELARLEKTALAADRMVSVGVRLTTQPEGLWRKFGISLESLPVFLEKVATASHLKMCGLQFHTSWNMGPESQTAFIGRLGGMLQSIQPALRDQIEFLDIGGGYWPEQGEWLQPAGVAKGQLRNLLGKPSGPWDAHYCFDAAPIGVFARAISVAVTKHLRSVMPVRICLEPGRWVCNDAMHLLIRVVDKKDSDLVITDGGTNAVGWERFENDYFPVLNLTRPGLTERPCHVLGSLCTPHDVWGYSYWGQGIEAGDILMIPIQGAYTYSLRQHFIKPLPEVLDFKTA